MTSILTLQDLQSRPKHTPKHDKLLVNALPQLSDNELIILLVNRYNRLDEKIGNLILKEVSDRKFNKGTVLKLYRSIRFFETPMNKYCPCCQSEDYIIFKDDKPMFCLICGYDICYDNPRSIMNRIRWKMGFYSFKKMKAKDLLELLNDS